MFFHPFFLQLSNSLLKRMVSLHLSCVWAESHLLHLVQIPANNWTCMGILTLISIGGHKHFRKKIKVKLQNCLHKNTNTRYLKFWSFIQLTVGENAQHPRKWMWRTCKHLQNWNPCCTEPPQAKCFTILWLSPAFKKYMSAICSDAVKYCYRLGENMQWLLLQMYA